MGTYGVFESVNMASTKYAARIFDAVATEDIENGVFGYIDELADGESVIYNFHKGLPADVAGKTLVVVDYPAWDYDTCKVTNQRKDKYINKAGVPFTVRELRKNDEFGISKECVTVATVDKLVKDAFLTIDSTTGKLVAAEATTADAVFEAVVMRKRVQGATLVTTANKYGYSRDIFEAKIIILA